MATLRNASPRAVTAVLQLVGGNGWTIAGDGQSAPEDGMPTWIETLPAGATHEIGFTVRRGLRN